MKYSTVSGPRWQIHHAEQKDITTSSYRQGSLERVISQNASKCPEVRVVNYSSLRAYTDELTGIDSTDKPYFVHPQSLTKIDSEEWHQTFHPSHENGLVVWLKRTGILHKTRLVVDIITYQIRIRSSMKGIKNLFLQPLTFATTMGSQNLFFLKLIFRDL